MRKWSQNYPNCRFSTNRETTWDYSQSTDVLGRIVEVVSGQELDVFIAERIAKPLKLMDTVFWAEGANRLARVAQAQMDPATGTRPAMMFDATKRPAWISGGGGMLSTAADYARFCQMLLNKGTLDGVRLVAPKTVEMMAANHLPPGTKFGPGILGTVHRLSSQPRGRPGFWSGIQCADGSRPQSVARFRG